MQKIIDTGHQAYFILTYNHIISEKTEPKNWFDIEICVTLHCSCSDSKTLDSLDHRNKNNEI